MDFQEFRSSFHNNDNLTAKDFTFLPEDIQRHLGINRIWGTWKEQEIGGFSKTVRGDYLFVVNYKHGWNSKGVLIHRSSLRAKTLSPNSKWIWRPLIVPEFRKNNTPALSDSFQHLGWDNTLGTLYSTYCSDMINVTRKYVCGRTHYKLYPNDAIMYRIDGLYLEDTEKFDILWKDGVWTGNPHLSK